MDVGRSVRWMVLSALMAVVLIGCTRSEEGGDEGAQTNPYVPCDDEDCVGACLVSGNADVCGPSCGGDQSCPGLAGYEPECDGMFCTLPCNENEDCPEGMTCSGETCVWGDPAMGCSECGNPFCNSMLSEDESECICEEGYEFCVPDPDDFECCFVGG